MFDFANKHELILLRSVFERIPIDLEKLLYVLSHPAGLLSRKNDDFWNFWTCPFSKSGHFLKFGHFSREGFPGQTTMLTTSAAKF